MKLSLYLKFALVFIGIMITTSLSLFFVLKYYTEATVEKQIGEKLENKSAYIMNSIDRFVFERLDDIQSLSEEFRDVNCRDTSSCEADDRLFEVLSRNSLYESFSFFDTNRVRLFDTDSKSLGQQHTMSIYWQKLDESDGNKVLDISFSESRQQVVMHFACKVFDKGGDLKGYIVSRILIDRLYEVFSDLIDKSDLGKDLLIDLIDSNNVLLYSNKFPHTVLRQKHPYSKQIDEAREDLDKRKNAEYFETDNRIYLLSSERGYKGYDGSNWMLIMSLHKDAVFAPLHDLYIKWAIILIILLLIGIPLAWIFARSYARPIINMSEIAYEYGRGNFSKQLSITAKDERKTLADSITFMAKELQHKIELTNLKNESLRIWNKEVSYERDTIKHMHNQTKSSIRYALKLQKSLLPNFAQIRATGLEIEVFSKPLDIIGGDTYFGHVIDEDRIILALIDCTGHGVPGAFMSVIAHNTLNKIIDHEENFDPASILKELDETVKSILRKDQSQAYPHDGMDICILLIDQKTSTLTFSGAYRPLIITNKSGTHQFKGAKVSIGDFVKEEINGAPYFENQEIPFDDNTKCFMFSDGMTDQFNVESDKKFGKKRLISCIENTNQLSIKEQVQELKLKLSVWQKTEIQTDDMLFIALDFKNVANKYKVVTSDSSQLVS